MEVEFRSIANGICELLWIRGILLDLRLDIQAPMRLYCNSNATINIAHDPVQHNRTKHVEVNSHFIKEKIQFRLIYTPYVRTGDQLANVFTQGLSSPQFCSIVSKLGMQNM